MGRWSEYIARKKEKWVGRVVSYKGNPYTVVDVDYNGALMINKKAAFTGTTAVSEFDLDGTDIG